MQRPAALDNKTIIDELYIIWEEGKMTGFDFRYTVEAVGEEVTKDFIKHAESIGRINY